MRSGAHSQSLDNQFQLNYFHKFNQLDMHSMARKVRQSNSIQSYPIKAQCEIKLTLLVQDTC